MYGITHKEIEKMARFFDNGKVMDLSNYGLTDDAIELLVKTIKHPDKKIYLNLKSNSIEDQGIKYITNKLKKLKVLDLSDCKITDQGVDFIVNQLEGLARLNLSGCNVTDKGVKNIAVKISSLKSLSFSSHEITDVGVKSIATFMSHTKCLKSLELSSNSITDVGVEYITTNLSSLSSLSLSSNSITDVGVEYITTNLSSLSSLSLSSDSITDVGLKYIAQNLSALMSLNLSGCKKITDVGVRSIATFMSRTKRLKFLELSSNNITDVGLKYIAQNLPSLSSLSLSSNSITDEGVRYIAQNLPALMSLNLSGCKKITDQGAIRVIRSMFLKELDLSGCNITDRALTHLCNQSYKREGFFNNLCEAKLPDERNSISSNVGGDTIWGGRSLNLSNCKGITDAGVSYVAHCRFLEELNLSGSSVTDKGLKHIGFGLYNLRILDLSNCSDVTDKMIAPLLINNLPKLEFLNVLGCNNISIAMLNSTIRLRPRLLSLKSDMSIYKDDFNTVDLSYSKLPLSDVIERVNLFLKLKRKINKLNLEGNNIKQFQLKSIISLLNSSEICQSLKSLNLSGCEIDDKGLEVITKELTHLKTLILAGYTAGSFLEGLFANGRMPNLRTLVLADCNMEVDMVVASRITQKFQNLESLDLSGCRISDKGLEIIAKGLIHLKTLILANCDMASINDGLLAIGGMSNLRTLVLADCNMEVDTMVASCITQKFQNLESLDLSGCRISDKGLEIIAKGLICLKTLILANCDMASINDGLLAIGKMSNLESLNFSSCGEGINDNVIYYIARTLPNLKLLNIAYCKITEQGVKTITNKLKGLSSLNLSGSNISEMDARSLARQLNCLKLLDLSNCQNINDKILGTFTKEFPHLTFKSLDCKNLGFKTKSSKLLIIGF
ncbi:leucine rich repeat (LRR) protein [Allofrancisella inopinata]|uniref:F-box/LRR-repeat protein 15-like leucin rich repeat domain-containing protein n=1 Tax=Allofrancisella inopinata TaxID=1085647 RepID=A0AAE7CR61_9GAMM|nr:hypothetical protein [Allofrancisella inopinata]QIV96660.1 hypothetical protein E4K63_07380 [Allofrancisella inopinata]TDT67380.1 leucine rich repeat (LRR) protein [Allofrancisella inopinata]